MSTPAFTYATRVIPAASILVVLTLLFVSLVVAPYANSVSRRPLNEATSAQLVLAAYTVFLHVLSVVFPARLCWAINDVIKKMKEMSAVVDKPKKRKMKTLRHDNDPVSYAVPVFVIIVPNYKEEMETMEETLRVLASHSQARHCYDIYLAMEEKEQKSDVKAELLIKTFHKSFRRMCFTVHPANIPGEAQGKSSNEAWAANQALTHYPEEMKKDIVITVMDADSHLSSRYFAQVTRHHLDRPERKHSTIYVPPLVFDRNMHQVPLLVRTADLAWAGAGLSSLHSSSTICIPTSVYSLPMTLVEKVGGWDTGPDAIGEDMHMYLKCFFALSGNLDVTIIYAATSQCNVSSNLDGYPGYVDGLRSRYRQALRHMWGSLDTGFAVRKTIDMCWRHMATEQDLRKFAAAAPWDVTAPDGQISDELVKGPAIAAAAPSKPVHKYNVVTLFHRIFEAHFLPIHLAVILTCSNLYMVLGGTLPRELHWALIFAGHSRTIGWLLMAVFFYRYDQYHRLCVAQRQAEMLKAGMMADLAERDAFTHNLGPAHGLIEAIFFPIAGFLFGSIPHAHAVLAHLTTDRLTYHVSLKPQFALRAAWQGLKQSPNQSCRGGVQAATASWFRPACDSLLASVRWASPVKTKGED